LYDKISRDDILAHAYAQCRSNKGAPGIDGQDSADIEAYGVERWLAELALALRQARCVRYDLPIDHQRGLDGVGADKRGDIEENGSIAVAQPYNI
jgi:hypothetical protein